MLRNKESFWKNKFETLNFWLLIMVWIGVTFCFFYDDQLVNVGHALTFWKSILKGSLTGGYQECLEEIYSAAPHPSDIPAVYEPMVYLIIGLLSVPLIVLNQLGWINFGTVNEWFNLYVKFQQILLVFGCAYAVWKMCLELKYEITRAKYAVFLFVSNMGLIYFAVVIGQLEIYTTFFSMWGIYYWMRKDNIKFILFFAIAIPMKLFSLLIFFPLVLIRQKKIIPIISYLLGGISIYILCKVIWLTDEAYRICTAEPGQRMINLIKGKQIPGGISGVEGIPIFICLYLIVCFLIFLCKREDSKWGCYCSFLIYSLLFLFVGHYPYWIVIITPFFPILIAGDREKESVNLLADFVFWCSYIISALLYNSWVTNYSIVNNMFLPRFFGRKTLDEIAYVSVDGLLRNYHFERYAAFFVACYAAALIILLIVNYPKCYKSFVTIELKNDIINTFRIAMIIPILCSMCYCYYTPKLSALWDTSGTESVDMGYNLFSEEVNSYGERALTQKIRFNNNAQVNKIKVFFNRMGNAYYARGALIIKFKDITKNKTLYSKRIGYNELTLNDFTVLDVGKVSVDKEHEYAVLISNDFWQSPDLWTYIKITTENIIPEPLEYLGNDVGHDLYMKIEGIWE